MKLFNRRNLIFLLLLSGLVIGLVLWREFGESLPSARVTQAQRGNLTQTFRTNGIVEPAEFREVRAEFPGRVLAVYFREGQHVRVGQSLARLDDRDALEAIAQARAQLFAARQGLAKVRTRSSLAQLESEIEAAQVDFSVAESNRKRDEYLLKQKAISQWEFDQTDAAYQKSRDHLTALKRQRQDVVNHLEPLAVEEAQARVEQARTALGAAQNRLRATRVPAPLAGTVLVKPPNPGTLVNTGDLLAKVGDLARLRVRAFIDQPDFSAIHVGSTVQITSTGFPGEMWQGQVERVSAELTTIGKRVVGEALCTILGDHDPLPVNSNVDLTFTSREMHNVLLVPVDAVFQTDSHNSVYRVRSGRLHRQTVEVGASNADSIVVLSGIKEGDVVLDDLEIQPKEGLRISPRPVSP